MKKNSVGVHKFIEELVKIGTYDHEGRKKKKGMKKNSVGVHKFIEELVKIEFPASKPVCQASSKFGPALVPGPVIFVFEKVSTFIVTEEKVEPLPEAAKTEEAAGGKEKEIVVVEQEKKKRRKEGKKEEVVEKIEEEKIEVVTVEAEKAEAAAAPASTEPAAAKVEEAKPPKP